MHGKDGRGGNQNVILYNKEGEWFKNPPKKHATIWEKPLKSIAFFQVLVSQPQQPVDSTEVATQQEERTTS